MARYQNKQTGIVEEISSPELNPELIVGKSLVSDTTSLGGTAGFQSITSDSLSPQPTINIPEPTTTDYLGNTNSTNAVIESYIKNTPKPPSLMEGYKDLQNTPEFQAKEQAYQTSKADLDALNAEIQGLTYQKDVVIPNQKQQEATGRGITAGGLAPITASEQRATLLKLAPLQYNALIKSAEVTNNANILNTAQKHIDNTFQVYSKDVENDYNYKKDLRDKVYEFATAKEKAQLDKMNKEDDRKFELKKDDINYAKELAVIATENFQPELASQLLSLDPNSQTYTQDIGSIQGQMKGDTKKALEIVKLKKEIEALGLPQITNPDTKQYSGVIKTILGSTSFTKDQKANFINSINSGGDPVTVIKNQAKNIMGQTQATKVDNYEIARDQIVDIDTALKNYYLNGGSTSLFTGNYESVINKLGKVSNPKLVDIATQIQSALQVYRNAVSGTAYSVQEGADIASIFPAINKSSGLNKAIIDGRLKAFNTTIDSAYRTAIGSGYDEVKKAEQEQNDPYKDFRSQLQEGEILVNRNGKAVAVKKVELLPNDIKL